MGGVGHTAYNIGLLTCVRYAYELHMIGAMTASDSMLTSEIVPIVSPKELL